MHKLTGHNDHIRGLCFTPKGELVSASLDETALVFDDADLSAGADTCSRRFVVLPSAANAIAAAPLESRYAQLVAVGCADGNVSFVDLSFTSQQPLFREARMVIERDRHAGHYNTIS